jgi:trehalose/maltose hydrolase-like predicted phosphorylase
MLMLVDPLARAAVVSVGPEPSGVPAPVLHLGGGPARFVELLDAQLARRRHHRVPQIDFDPSWVVTLPDSNGHVTWHDSGSGPAAGTLASHTDSKVAESIGALGNGHAATRGTWEEDAASGAATLLVGGVYTDDNHLLPGPNWTGLDLSSTHQPHTGRRHLDLRTGSLVRSGELRSFRFVSQTDPHALALRAESASHRLQAGHPLIWDKKVVHKVEHDARGEALAARLGGANGGLCVAARNHVQTVADLRVVERLATWDATPSGQASFDAAHSRLTELTRVGFDTLLADHRAAWAARWRDAQVVIEGDPACELASRFAIFNLLNAAPRTGEAGVGARGLTGAGYAGHVFWDADVFVLPALAALCPPAARTMLEYRIARLGPARQRARAQGHSGARFPWESAADGTEVTPTQVVDTHGELVDVLTGVHEEHVVADVAWAANRYAAWTGDTAFLTGPGADLITDTARYWASRVQPDSAGHGHFLSVMGPDEYHEVVDDSAYTAIMARWNLRCAADLENAQNPGSPEAASWSAIAESLVDGWDSTRGCYEQFAGYFDLEPLLMDQVGSPPLDADTLLGRPRVVSSQILKQADVIMAHHLIGEQMVDGSLAADLAFYEPRTAHGSSLSPAIYAAQLARAGQPERALELFKMAALIDLSDLTGSTAAGLHLATMGGVWQALAYGFCGLRERAGTLAIDPCLPAQWEGLGLTFHFGGQRVSVHATHDRVQVTSERPLLISVADHADQLCGAAGINIPL